jgi:hypothetical protein
MANDLEKYKRQTTIQLVVGGLALVFLLGAGLIYLLYGPGAAFLGVLCIGAGLIPIFLIMFFLWGIDSIVKRNRND